MSTIKDMSEYTQAPGFTIEIHGRGGEIVAAELPLHVIEARDVEEWFTLNGDETDPIEQQSWHQLDQLFHASGAFVSESDLVVKRGESVIYESPIIKLINEKSIGYSSTEYPFTCYKKKDSHAVVLATEVVEGQMYKSEDIKSSDGFDISKLAITVYDISIMDTESEVDFMEVVVASVRYDGVEPYDTGMNAWGTGGSLYIDSSHDENDCEEDKIINDRLPNYQTR